MISGKRDMAATLDFFKHAILQPTLIYCDTLAGPELGEVVPRFAAIEAACWASMGVRIGYFDPKDTYDLFSSSTALFEDALNALSLGGHIKRWHWREILHRMPPKFELTLSERFFVSRTEQYNAEELDLIQRTFQTLLLLTSENLLNGDSFYFLGNIGWTSSEVWNRQIMPRDGRGSAQRIGAGFSNAMNYWEEIVDIPVTDRPLEAGVRTRLSHFVDEAAWIVRPRFNLGNEGIVDRYFILAGEFVRWEREKSTKWLDARGRVFNQLLTLIGYVRGAKLENEERLWNEFVSGIPNPTNEYEDVAVKSESDTAFISAAETKPEKEKAKEEPPDEKLTW